MCHALAPKSRKPSSLLEGPHEREAGFKTILVYCVGPARAASYHENCHHYGRLRLDDLPDWDWRDISAHLKCIKCGTVGYVDARQDWSEVINFNKGVG
jgi:hypothetical protein